MRKAMVSDVDTPLLINELREELRANLLPFWRSRSVDSRQGGFIGEMDAKGNVVDCAPKGLILNARLLWTFSALFRLTGDERDRHLAQRAHAYLRDHFRDEHRGGYHWEVDADDQVMDPLKRNRRDFFPVPDTRVRQTRFPLLGIGYKQRLPRFVRVLFFHPQTLPRP